MQNEFDPAQVIIPHRKITHYLLSDTHPSGRFKARFFKKFGFNSDAPEVLEHALGLHAHAQPIETIEATPFGTRYTVRGPFRTPDGRNPTIVSVWIVEEGTTAARFVTAFPG